MALSKIDLEEAGRLRTEILANKNRSFAEISAIISRAQSMLSEFEAKLAVLEREKERAYQALCQCELHKNDDEDDPKSCDAEESAYQRAAARYERCLSLVNQARNVIRQFQSRAAQSRGTINGLVLRSEHAMNYINQTLQQYLCDTNSAAAGAGGPMGGSGQGNGEDGHGGNNGEGGQNDGHGGAHGGNGGQGGPGGDSQGDHGGGNGDTGGEGQGHGSGPGGEDQSSPSGDEQGFGDSNGDIGNQSAYANNSDNPIFFGSGNGTEDFGPISPDAATIHEGASGGTIAAGVGLAGLAAGAAVGTAAYYQNKDKKEKGNIEEKDGELHFTYVNDDYSSSPDFDMFNPIWEVEKKTKNLPYETVDDYLEHEMSEANKVINSLREASNLSNEEMLDKLESRKTEIDQSLDNCISSYEKQLDLLEKNYQLAQYKVEYQNLKMMEYMEKNTLNPDPHGDSWEKAGTWLANVIPTPWTKEYREKYGDFGGGWYPKEMERREKELIDKYGISQDEINSMKFVVDNDKTIANIASTTDDIHKGAKSASDMVISNKNDRDFIKGGIDNVNDSMPLAVAAEDYYKAKTYESERDSLLESKAKVEANFAKSRQDLEKQKEKIECLSNLIDATNADNSSSMNRHDKLTLANKMGSDIECVRDVLDSNKSKRMEEYDSLISSNN